MLKQLRSRKTMRVIMKIALFLVIPSFIGLYGWSSIRSSPNRGGGDFYRIKMKEHPLQFRWSKISDSEMKMAKSDLLMEYQRYLGIRNPEMMEMVDDLITPRLLAYQAIENRRLLSVAEDKGVQGTMPELRNQIMAVTNQIRQMYPGVTAKDALNTMMQMEGYSPAQDEAYVQNQLYKMTLDKTQFLYGMRAKASLFELWQDYLLAEEKVKVSYVNLKTEDFKDQITASEDDMTKYFEENKEDYRVPEKNRYEYVLIRKYDLIQKAEASDEAVMKYYDENKETEFKQERQALVRQILLNVPGDATEEDVAEIKSRADDLYTSITVHGAEISYLADQYSSDPANEEPVIGIDGKPTNQKLKKGGLLNRYLSADDAENSLYGKDIVMTALNMDNEEISRPIKGDRGFHIIKIEGKKEEKILPFEEVQTRAQRAVREKIGTARFDELKSNLNKIYDQTTTLSGLATQLNLEVQETPLVLTNATYIPGVGNIASFSDHVKNLAKGQMTNPLINNNIVAVLLLKEVILTHIPKLDEVKDDVKEDTIMAMALEKSESVAEEIFKEASSPETMKKAAEKRNLEALETESFTHTNPPGELAGIKDLAITTVRTKVGIVKKSPVMKQGYGLSEPEGYAVWCLTEKIEPEKSQFKEDLGRIQRDAIMAKQRTIINESLADLREEAEYVINPDFLNAR